MYIIQDRRADDGKGTDDVRLVSERTSCRHADSYSVDFDVWSSSSTADVTVAQILTSPRRTIIQIQSLAIE
jgi:hypothetical protein